ncbi:MAG TPA: M48 family metallopeptidase [Longimicrobium sp.]|nr:M48 family metallopeptidase [Longimicrobium sp.]
MSRAAGGSAHRARHGRARLAALGLALLPAVAGCVNEAQERDLGGQIAANLNARIPLVRDAPLNLYVNDLGRLVAKHSGRPDLQYRFFIVDTDAVNAFALPGGYIYVDRGLIARTRNVSELAGVLAHEIAHVALRHGARNLERQMRTSGMSSLLYRKILGRGPLLDQQALQVGNQLWAASHSRSDETAADREAVKYLIATGVDPNGMVELFQELMREERANPQAQSAEWFSTHPNTARRLQLTEQTIQELMPQRQTGIRPLAHNNASYPLFLQRMQMLPPSPPLIPGMQVPLPGE